MTEREWLYYIRRVAAAIHRERGSQPCITEEDLFQEGCVGYLKARAAARLSDERYVKLRIKGHMYDAFHHYGLPRAAYRNGMRAHDLVSISAIGAEYAYVVIDDVEVDVSKALLRCSKDDSRILREHYIDGKSKKDIGSGSSSTGWHRLRAALSRLRKELGLRGVTRIR